MSVAVARVAFLVTCTCNVSKNSDEIQIDLLSIGNARTIVVPEACYDVRQSCEIIAAKYNETLLSPKSN